MIDNQQRTPKVVGSLHSIDDHTGKVRVESVYDTTVEDLWAAITQPDRLARWIAVVRGELRVGGEVHARFTSGWEGLGRIDVCDERQRLLLTMCPDTREETVIEATISQDGSGLRLVVEERGIALTEIAVHGAGWHVHLEDLASHLAGRERPEWKPRWVELSPHYQRLQGDRHDRTKSSDE